MLHINAIPAFSDNYIWLIHQGQLAILVDPGDAIIAKATLMKLGLSLIGILITHHHQDHCGGVTELLRQSKIPVYGPASEKLPLLTDPLQGGDTVSFPELALKFQVMDIPGHTQGHIAYLAPGLVFCGDTLFTGGCGKIFEGTAQQMYQSLQKLANLPDNTAFYCGHEYTLANLQFGLTVEPHNQALQQRLEKVKILRKEAKPTVPEILAIERLTNPFLRCDIPEVRAAVEHYWKNKFKTPVDIFAALRLWKNEFLGFNPLP